MNMHEVYLVLFDWSTEDDAQIETYLYRNYDDAVRKFKRIMPLCLHFIYLFVKFASYC